MQKNRLETLYKAMVANDATKDELKEFVDLASHEAHEAEMMALMDETYDEVHRIQLLKDQAKVVTIRRREWRRLAVAAVFIALVGIGIYVITQKENGPGQVAEVIPTIKDVAAPDASRATLQLADGTIIYLDSAQNGSVASEGSVRIIKLADGSIQYKGANADAALTYNTVSNPRGSQVISLTLVDGTKVWLNAASSITFPTTMSGNERKVQITGEGFFEVAHNATMPFKVEHEGVTVQVLGTHFNVNSYADEDLKVTLLEGSVRVSSNNKDQLLKPGQQAVIKEQSIQLIRNADIEEALAWKDGRFHFNESNIEDIMRQVSRWYDVQVEFKGDMKDLDFSGIISRKENISRLLNLLETTGTIHFTVEGRKVIVNP